MRCCLVHDSIEGRRVSLSCGVASDKRGTGGVDCGRRIGCRHGHDIGDLQSVTIGVVSVISGSGSRDAANSTRVISTIGCTSGVAWTIAP